MKKVFSYLAIILTLVISSMFILNEIYSYSFRNGIVRNKRQELLLHKNDKFDILFLGSSRTESHVVDSVFENITNLKVINAGMERSTLHDSYAVFYSLLKNNNKLSECWIQLDYTHNITKHSANMFAEIVPFLNDETLESHAIEIGQISSVRVPFTLFMKNDKPIGFREFFLKVINKKSEQDFSLQFKPLLGCGTGLKGKWPKSMESNIAMNKILKLAKEYGIRVHFYTSPNCPKAENRDDFGFSLKENYRFKNYYDIFDDSLDYFYDCGHLNNKGALAFTKLLAEDFLRNKTCFSTQ
ncbi:hypothetical protein [uncultured Nonlabens sp.]|uniref:hypothetical protein n=1 Tax=uncultured Nonlabens sp. TaxID=859306 RepID=UPI002634AFDA|nr:hypothetical protein [uncultured Nonlabens sp.]